MMNDERPAVRRRTCLRMTAGLTAVGMVGLSGCQGNGSDDSAADPPENDDADDSDADRTESDRETRRERGSLATRVIDRPGDIGDFSSFAVSFAGLWTQAVDEPESNREYHAFETPRIVDFVALRTGRTRLIDERDLPSGQYDRLLLDVSSINATLLDGSAATVSVVGDAPLAFPEPFEISAETATTFVAPVTPVRSAGGDEYALRPVTDATTVHYGDEGDPSETDDPFGPSESDADSESAGSHSADVVHAIGRVSAVETIDTVEVVVKRSAGSDRIDLSQFRLEVDSDATDATLVHGGDGSRTDPTAETFVTTTIAGDSAHDELVSLSDRAAITFDAALVRGDDGLPPGSSATLTLRSDDGSVFAYAVDVPATFGGYDVVSL